MTLYSFSTDSAAGEVIGQVLRYGQNFRLGITGGFDDRMVSHHVACLLGPVTFVSGWATGYLLKWTENSTGMGSISGLIIVIRLQLFQGSFGPILCFQPHGLQKYILKS